MDIPADLLQPLRRPIFILSGAGLSAASGIPTFRDQGGLWEGNDPRELATPEAWFRDRDKVRRFYRWRVQNMGAARPNEAHRALVRLQAALGPRTVVLVTQNVDGLLQQAGRDLGIDAQVMEMHGTIHQQRCEAEESHPAFSTEEEVPRCPTCGAFARPAVVWFGEMPHHLDIIGQMLQQVRTFISVGTSGQVYPAAGFVKLARPRALCLEINAEATSEAFHHSLVGRAEELLPRLVEAWTR
jgi:NAD-dependent deacetylase